MASIQKITEFVPGRKTLSGTHITVYYETGRKVNYYGTDTLPLTVANFLTSDKTTSETTYINDDHCKCINKRTTYRQ